jgi:hypothetical protein
VSKPDLKALKADLKVRLYEVRLYQVRLYEREDSLE